MGNDFWLNGMTQGKNSKAQRQMTNDINDATNNTTVASRLRATCMVNRFSARYLLQQSYYRRDSLLSIARLNDDGCVMKSDIEDRNNIPTEEFH